MEGDALSWLSLLDGSGGGRREHGPDAGYSPCTFLRGATETMVLRALSSVSHGELVPRRGRGALASSVGSAQRRACLSCGPQRPGPWPRGGGTDVLAQTPGTSDVARAPLHAHSRAHGRVRPEWGPQEPGGALGAVGKASVQRPHRAQGKLVFWDLGWVDKSSGIRHQSLPPSPGSLT